MGANLCTMSGISLKDCIKPKQNRTRCAKTFKRKKIEKKILPIGTKFSLEEEDWILSSSSSEMKQSKKRVHPCSTRFRAELPKDSLCLKERFKSRFGETDEGLTSDCSLVTRSFCEKSKKNSVRFKLPHTVIFYKPEEPYREEEENEEALLRRYYSSEEDSFSSPKCRELYSFETAEEPILRLAVDVLPHVFVSSKVSN
ncbi:hypothetical protein TSUD_203360 [Trifolium subterraneum]|uniref:Uncharacterized protein n=1 Tax=Trifolium subterraneum TaxID=3900 RepID=A0A2Z6MK28_TRISU|nr:hypothetical protein TSUD_203360 [Trifolium subterraneum]